MQWPNSNLAVRSVEPVLKQSSDSGARLCECCGSKKGHDGKLTEHWRMYVPRGEIVGEMIGYSLRKTQQGQQRVEATNKAKGRDFFVIKDEIGSFTLSWKDV